MPRIRLKPKSPEFADDGRKATAARHCDMPGCAEEAAHKAPKNRGLNDYYWFCFSHIQEYNKAWDFFSGMSQSDVEDHIRRSFLWDRPTRRFDNTNIEENLQKKAWQKRYFSDDDPADDSHKGKGFRFGDANMRATPEVQAMAIMGLEPPLDIAAVKARYKILVKKYHPDVNPDDPKAEEMIKSVNMAYTILKLAYEKFEILDK
ncbi:MAG TPA: J domain-containing protein [Micavibrio sp.]